MSEKILIIAAHPDDEILGCGGTVARMVKEGYEAYTLIMAEGITSRNSVCSRDELSILRQQTYKAGEITGVKEVILHSFPDNRLDTVALLDIIKIIEEVKEKIKPEIIFTHYEKDLNVDHRKIYEAVITATRPLPGESVKDIYSFEVLSSTEWNYPLSFSPDVFFDISDTIEIKKSAMAVYTSELREFPHPRSIKGIEINAQYWGMKVGLNYAEAFKTVRRVLS